MNDFIKENLEKAENIVNQNKDYNKERNLPTRIQMFELYKFAKNWINKYKLSE